MTLFARRVKGPMWTQASDPERWVNDNFPHGLLADLFDKNGGVSVWQIESPADPALKRIAAALAAEGNAIQSVEFRTFRKSDADQLNIKLVQRRADTLDNGVNDLHWELDDLTGPQALKLMKIMSEDAVPFTTAEVSMFMAESVAAGHISLLKLNQHHLLDLRKIGALRVVVPVANSPQPAAASQT